MQKKNAVNTPCFTFLNLKEMEIINGGGLIGSIGKFLWKHRKTIAGFLLGEALDAAVSEC